MVSYSRIFGPFKGNIFQRLLKILMFPMFPKLAVFIYTILGVGVFRFIVMNTVAKWRKDDPGRQTNYRIGQKTTNNILTFITDQTLFNEVIHAVVTLPSLPTMISLPIWIGSIPWFLTTAYIVVFLINLYCVFLQRYNRARLALWIVERVNDGDLPDDSYKNWLAFDFGEDS